MMIPVVRGRIARRILVNFRADPQVIQAVLPSPFRPKLHNGHAIVGICLIRLENIRPRFCSLPVGLSSENAAHRIAVLWDDDTGKVREGVFIPRRDTSSFMNHLTGGRIFPGQHELAKFSVEQTETHIDFSMESNDGAVHVNINGEIGEALPTESCFGSLRAASEFFEGGCVGYSVRKNSSQLDGLLLKIEAWQVETLDVSKVQSTYYSDTKVFPEGSVTFDHALLMRGLEHEWHSVQEPRNT